MNKTIIKKTSKIIGMHSLIKNFKTLNLLENETQNTTKIEENRFMRNCAQFKKYARF